MLDYELRTRRSRAERRGASDEVLLPAPVFAATAPRRFVSVRVWLVSAVTVVVVFLTVVFLNGWLPRAVPVSEAGELRVSEERVRLFLEQLVALGAKPTGSDAWARATELILRRVHDIQAAVTSPNIFIDAELHHPSGCFQLRFFEEFVNCYQNVTNIAVRLSNTRTLAPAFLLNCHYDSFTSSPGASDDGAGCAIMLELLYILSRDIFPLKYDIIFLFNGAEENVLEGSHGFITSHPWREFVKAFINLEGAGASGREVLFQSGPANYWLLQSYLRNVPYPHGSTIGQEIFQSGRFPGDTDFRIFRDYGNLSGLDIAYFQNGYVYHNEFDRPEFIASGSIQRLGDNLFQLVRAALSSPCLATDCHQHTSPLIFFDLFGVATVSYSQDISTAINLLVVVATLLVSVYELSPASGDRRRSAVIKENSNSRQPSNAAFCLLQFLAVITVTVCAELLCVALVKLLRVSMFWYSRRWFLLPWYVLLPATTGLLAHACYSKRLRLETAQEALRAELWFSHVSSGFFAAVLLWLTVIRCSSAYFFAVCVSCLLVKHCVCSVVAKYHRRLTPSQVVLIHVVATVPIVALSTYAYSELLSLVIPVMARTGSIVDSELIVALLSCSAAVMIVACFGSLVYLARNVQKYFAVVIFATAIALLAFALSPLCHPFSYQAGQPRPRRIIVNDVTRISETVEAGGQSRSVERGLWIVLGDGLGPRILPPLPAFINAAPVTCRNDTVFCSLPYLLPIQQSYLPETSLWYPLPKPERPVSGVSLKLVSYAVDSNNRWSYKFTAVGSDHMSLYVTCLGESEFVSWSFPVVVDWKQKAVFAYLAAGHSPAHWNFSITINAPSKEQTKPGAKILVAIASHHIHGPAMYSPEIIDLLEVVTSQRNDYSWLGRNWRWVMTITAWNVDYSEIYV